MAGSGLRRATDRRAILIATGMVVMSTGWAHAGGFAIREHSTSGLGSAFAGVAAGYDLSSMFWNPAALAAVPGTNTESHAAVIIPDTEIKDGVISSSNPFAQALVVPTLAPLNDSTSIAGLALVPASYAGHQVGGQGGNLFIGFGTNSPFGLTTKPDDSNWRGFMHGRRSSIFNMNANPVVAYKIAHGVAVGVGAQISYFDLTFKFGPAPDVTQPSAVINADDYGFGFTAGIMLEPVRGTNIGIGYRSEVEHELEGTFGLARQPNIGASADITLPDVVTISFRQAITPMVRVMGTYEWTRWSNLGELKAIAKSAGMVGATAFAAGDTITAIALDWQDSWFASVGLEFDHSADLTLRAGVGFEESPISGNSTRLVQVPDTDRTWASAGATYRYSENISLDFAYTHIFFEDGDIDYGVDRFSGLLGDVDYDLTAKTENSTDIVAFSFKYELGGGLPLLMDEPL